MSGGGRLFFVRQRQAHFGQHFARVAEGFHRGRGTGIHRHLQQHFADFDQAGAIVDRAADMAAQLVAAVPMAASMAQVTRLRVFS